MSDKNNNLEDKTKDTLMNHKDNLSKEDIESIREKIEEESEEYEEQRLKKVNELHKKKTGLSNFYISTVVFFSVFCFMFFFFFNLKQNPINVALKFKDMTISIEDYTTLRNDLNNMDKKLTEEQFRNYSADLLILSRYAKEEGITVTNKEVSHIKELGYSVLCEELALVKKLKDTFEEKAKNFTEEDYKKHYQDTKDPYYRKNGNISYYYIKSEKELDYDKPLDKSKLQLKQSTLEELNLNGVYDFTEGVLQHLLIDEESNTNHYIYIEKAKMTYHPYEKVEEEVKKHLNYVTTDGKLLDIALKEKEMNIIETFEKK